MIIVNGEPFGYVGNDDSEDDFEKVERLLKTLLEHPALKESANALKGVAPQIIKPPYPSGNDEVSLENGGIQGIDGAADPKFVYVFQKEFATVSPLFAEFVGTDEITTCIGVVVRHPSSGLTSVGHFDSAELVAPGLNQLVSSVISIASDVLQVHLVGAFDDSHDYNMAALAKLQTSNSENDVVMDGLSLELGWSWPLALRMIDTLHNSPHSFEIETCCLLPHNTAVGPSGHTWPIVRGFVVETSSGRLKSARFEREARGPDGTVREVCATTVTSGPNYQPSLLSPYVTLSDTFVISPFNWSRRFERYATYMLTLDDATFLNKFSTSPYAESTDFVPAARGTFSYIQNFPDWRQTFVNSQSRIFSRSSYGGWVRKQNCSC